jgi:hypothetical protein
LPDSVAEIETIPIKGFCCASAAPASDKRPAAKPATTIFRINEFIDFPFPDAEAPSTASFELTVSPTLPKRALLVKLRRL